MKTKLIISIIVIGCIQLNWTEAQSYRKFIMLGALLDSTTELRDGNIKIYTNCITIRDNTIDKTYILNRLSDTEGYVKADSVNAISYFMKSFDVLTTFNKDVEPARLLLYISLSPKETFWEAHLFKNKQQNGGYNTKVCSYFVVPEEEIEENKTDSINNATK